MQQVIMAIHLMTVVALVTLILYQKSEGGALGLGQSGFFSGRGQANALTRATGILATVFFVTSILLTVIPAWERRSVGGEDWTKAIDQEKVQVKEIKPEAAPPAQKETQIPKDKESIFEQLKRAQEQRQSGGGTPALRASPEAPAQPAPKSEAAPAAPEQPAPKSEAAPAAPEPAAPKAEGAPAAPEQPAPKSEAAPAAPEPAAPKAEGAPAAAEQPAPKSETAPAAPKAEAKPEDAKPAPEAAPAPAAPPPPVQWKSPTK